MSRRAAKCRNFKEPIPDVVRDEAIIVPPNETGYWLLLDDATVESLAKGICPEDLARRCHQNCLDWKRRHYRNEARSFDAVTQGS